LLIDTTRKKIIYKRHVQFLTSAPNFRGSSSRFFFQATKYR